MLRTILLAAAIAATATSTMWAQKPAVSPFTKAQANEESNIRAYIDLLRTDIKSQKVQVLSGVMQFTPDEASAFWPIYKAYDSELTKLGDQKLAIIQEYADNFSNLTDAKADDLVNKFLAVKSQRDAALRKCYDQVREKMGGKMAARFIQVESQLLLLIDLKVSSLLPAVE